MKSFSQVEPVEANDATIYDMSSILIPQIPSQVNRTMVHDKENNRDNGAYLTLGDL